MYSFRNDYSEGADTRILQALIESNKEQSIGYGEDSYSKKAKQWICQEIQQPEAYIHFLVGGTQTNLLAISSFLRPHEAVIGTTVSHIYVHETGAIEATGHKVVTVDTKDGKLTIDEIDSIIKQHDGVHMVKPKMVYLSNTTELGTVYQKKELERISQYCKEHNLWLYMDGARIGSALCASSNDMTMADIASYVDCFSIGGTKNGALFGEALVICNPILAEDFTYFVKQKGALLAKGRLLGIQFKALFEGENKLFYELAKHANLCAMELKQGLQALGIEFLTDSYSNQLFPIFKTKMVEALKTKYEFEIMHSVDHANICIRLVTSWATPLEAVKDFIDTVSKMEIH